MPKTETSGKNWYINDYGYIYVQGRVGRKYYRKSTGMPANPKNIAYIKRNAANVLSQLIDKKPKLESFEAFGRKVTDLGSKKRSNGVQRDAMARFENHILPFFIKYEIADIRAMDVEAWQNEMLQKFSSGTVKAIRHILCQIFKKAVANDMIVKNPCDYADKIEVTHRSREPYTLDEARAIIGASAGWLKVFLSLAFTTGLRTGEILGLMWDDINFEHRYIKLQRSRSKGIITENSKIKNHNRIIYISPIVVDLLLNLMRSSQSEFVFTSSKGTPWYETKSIINRHFKPLLERIGVEYKELYSTRHTFMSIAANDDLDTMFIQRVVGHTEGSAVTAKHYIRREISEEAINIAHAKLDPIANKVLAS